MTIRPMISVIYAYSIFLLLSGCATTQPTTSQESQEEVKEALSAVAGAMRGKELSEDELKELEHQIRNDKETQESIEAIRDSMSGKDVSVKYCPITGKRYAGYMETCPEHNIPLEPVEP